MNADLMVGLKHTHESNWRADANRAHAQGQLALTRDRARAIARVPARTHSGTAAAAADQHGHDGAAGGVRLDMALSRENLAQMVGTTKESAVRVLSDFRQEQLIEDSRRKMVLLSPHRLVEVAGFID